MSAESRSPSNSVCTHPRSHGIALITGAAGALLLMLAHPRAHSHEVATLVPELIEGAWGNGLVHGGMIAAVVVMFGGYLGLAELTDQRRLTTRIALSLLALGFLAWIAAATINGFVVPSMARGAEGRTAAELAWLAPLLRLCSHANQTLAQMGTIATSLGIAVWSLALLGRARGLAVCGIIVGVLTSTAVATGHLRMHLHGMLLVVALFGAWSAWAGVWLMRAKSPPNQVGAARTP